MKSGEHSKNIVVIGADKGNCTVVMERTNYRNEIQEMLPDQNVYTTITAKRCNPMSRTELELQGKLLDLTKLGNLSETDYWKLCPSDSTPASFYGLPKVHKVVLQ